MCPQASVKGSYNGRMQIPHCIKLRISSTWPWRVLTSYKRVSLKFFHIRAERSELTPEDSAPELPIIAILPSRRVLCVFCTCTCSSDVVKLAFWADVERGREIVTMRWGSEKKVRWKCPRSGVELNVGTQHRCRRIARINSKTVVLEGHDIPKPGKPWR